MVVVRIFACVDGNTVLDETTLGRFRHLLERHDLTKELFKIATQILMGHGILIRSGTLFRVQLSLAHPRVILR